jgi:type I restriction enzyme S subunit
MSSEQNTVLLGELISHRKGYAFKSKDYVDVGVPVIRVSNFTDDSISRDDLKFVSASIATINCNVILRANDIVVATVGSWPSNPASVVGRTISVPTWAENALMNQNSVIIRSKSASLMDQRFIYYQMKSKKFSSHVVSKAQGSANQASITLDAIFSFPLLWPASEVRASVVTTLNALDDRITLLRETNTTLEAIAQALFKSWFVDFDPVHAKMQGLAPEGMDEATAALFPDSFEESELGAVPKGWRVQKFGDFTDRQSVGKKFDQKTAFASGQVPILDQGKSGVIGFHNEEPGIKASLEKPVVVFANHTCYMRLICFDFSAIQNVLPFIGKGVDTVWAFYATKDRIKFSEYKGHWPDFAIEKAIVPSVEFTDVFRGVVDPLTARIRNNELQIQNMAALRDTLLPRLISGQLQLESMEARDGS